MINYNRLGYEIKRDFTNFSVKIPKGFVSASYENIQCLKSLTTHFSKTCVRTLGRVFDANKYYRYFLKNDEKFVIRSKKNRNFISEQ